MAKTFQASCVDVMYVDQISRPPSPVDGKPCRSSFKDDKCGVMWMGQRGKHDAAHTQLFGQAVSIKRIRDFSPCACSANVNSNSQILSLSRAKKWYANQVHRTKPSSHGRRNWLSWTQRRSIPSCARRIKTKPRCEQKHALPRRSPQMFIEQCSAEALLRKLFAGLSRAVCR